MYFLCVDELKHISHMYTIIFEEKIFNCCHTGKILRG